MGTSVVALINGIGVTPVRPRSRCRHPLFQPELGLLNELVVWNMAFMLPVNVVPFHLYITVLIPTMLFELSSSPSKPSTLPAWTSPCLLKLTHRDTVSVSARQLKRRR